MMFTDTPFIGIVPAAGPRPMIYAILDNELHPRALGETTLDGIAALVGEQQTAIVAVGGPRRPNQGLMKRAEIRETLSPPPRPGRWTECRVAEYQLRQRNIQIARTPNAEARCPQWVRNGFDLYRRLEALGFQDYPTSENSPRVLETSPQAVFTVLLGHAPFPRPDLEGRLQRQLILYDLGLDIPDPMRVFEEITRYRILQGRLPLDDLYAANHLDALAAAYTAWRAANSPDQVTILGHPAEGQIVLPAAGL